MFVNCLWMGCFRIVFVDLRFGDCLNFILGEILGYGLFQFYFLVIMGSGLFHFLCVLGAGWQVVSIMGGRAWLSLTCIYIYRYTYMIVYVYIHMYVYYIDKYRSSIVLEPRSHSQISPCLDNPIWYYNVVSPIIKCHYHHHKWAKQTILQWFLMFSWFILWHNRVGLI